MSLKRGISRILNRHKAKIYNRLDISQDDTGFKTIDIDYLRKELYLSYNFIKEDIQELVKNIENIGNFK